MRCRPATKLDGRDACIAVEGDAVTVVSGEEEAGFSFDVCLGMEADQSDVYDLLVSEPMEALFEGYNSTILAYGQTGSGKTYSMVGTEDKPGLIPRFARELFERATMHDGARVSASYLQLYNEAFLDLLEPQRLPHVARLEHLAVHEVLPVLQVGAPRAEVLHDQQRVQVEEV